MVLHLRVHEERVGECVGLLDSACNVTVRIIRNRGIRVAKPDQFCGLSRCDRERT
jgi:hypothetical protein